MEHLHKLAILTWREGDVYVADCPAVRIASQGDNEQETLDNLKEAIELYFEGVPNMELPGCTEAHVCEVEVALF